MKKILYILIAMCIFFTGCKDTTTAPTTPDTPTEPVVVTPKELSVSGYYSEVAYLNNSYYPSNNVIVKVKMSNGFVNEVTSKCTFECDTTKVGETDVIVKYEELTTTYKITVEYLELTYLSIETHGNELVHKTGDLFRTDDIQVTAYFKNGQSNIVTDYSYYFIKDGYKKIQLNTPGFYELVVVYFYGEKSLEAKIQFYVEGEPLPYNYERIDIDTTYVKKFYYEDEKLDYSNIIVKGMMNSMEAEPIDNTDIKVELYKSTNLVPDFTTNGEYIVKVIYIGEIECTNSNEATFKIEYREKNPNLMDIHFEYSESSIEGYTARVSKTEAINPLDHLQIPEGYAFIGFEKYDWNNLSEETSYIINIEKQVSGKSIVVFLNNDYTLFQKYEYAKNISIHIPLQNPENKLEGEANFFGWELNDDMFARTDRYIMSIFEKIENSILPIISIDSLVNVRITIPHEFEEIKETSIQVYELNGGLIEENKTTPTAIFKKLQIGKTYLVRGYVIGVGKTGDVKINLIEQKFTLSVLNKIQNKTPYDSLLIMSNEVIIDTSYYRDNITDYKFEGFVLKDKNNLIEKDVKVSDYDYKVTIDGLELFKQYKLYGRYSDSNGNSILIYYIDFETLYIEQLPTE